MTLFAKADMVHYLKSLIALNGTGHGKVSIEGRLFKVPAFTPEEPTLHADPINVKYRIYYKYSY